MLPDTIARRYTPVEIIHDGETGTLYQAIDHVFLRDVSLFVVSREQSRGETFSREFAARVSQVANLSSPHIAKLYDWGCSDGTYYIVSEYVEGIDLDELVSTRGPMGEASALRIGVQICRALSVAHGAGVVHGSIRPNNIVVSRDAGATLIGFAKIHKEPASEIETPAHRRNRPYRPPEQTCGGVPTEAGDLYSLASTLYKIMTGNVPFSADEVRRMAAGESGIAPKPLGESRCIPNPPIDAALSKALQARANERYASADQMREALVGCLKDRIDDRGSGRALPGDQNPGRRHDDPPEARARFRRRQAAYANAAHARDARTETPRIRPQGDEVFVDDLPQGRHRATSARTVAAVAAREQPDARAQSDTAVPEAVLSAGDGKTFSGMNLTADENVSSTMDGNGGNDRPSVEEGASWAYGARVKGDRPNMDDGTDPDEPSDGNSRADRLLMFAVAAIIALVVFLIAVFL